MFLLNILRFNVAKFSESSGQDQDQILTCDLDLAQGELANIKVTLVIFS